MVGTTAIGSVQYEDETDICIISYANLTVYSSYKGTWYTLYAEYITVYRGGRNPIPVLHTPALCLSFRPSRPTLVDMATDNHDNLPRSCNRIFRRRRTALDLAFDNFPKGVHHGIYRYHSSTSRHHFHHCIHFQHSHCHRINSAPPLLHRREVAQRSRHRVHPFAPPSP